MGTGCNLILDCLVLLIFCKCVFRCNIKFNYIFEAKYYYFWHWNNIHYFNYLNNVHIIISLKISFIKVAFKVDSS